MGRNLKNLGFSLIKRLSEKKYLVVMLSLSKHLYRFIRTFRRDASASAPPTLSMTFFLQEM